MQFADLKVRLRSILRFRFVFESKIVDQAVQYDLAVHTDGHVARAEAYRAPRREMSPNVAKA